MTPLIKLRRETPFITGSEMTSRLSSMVGSPLMLRTLPHQHAALEAVRGPERDSNEITQNFTTASMGNVTRGLNNSSTVATLGCFHQLSVSSDLIKPGSLGHQVILFRNTSRPRGRNSVVFDRRLVITDHFEQVATHCVEPVMPGKPMVGIKGLKQFE